MGPSYRKVDAWARGLSRVGYAALAGVLSAVVMLLLGVLLRESLIVEAVTMGLSMAAFYYWFDPNDER